MKNAKRIISLLLLITAVIMCCSCKKDEPAIVVENGTTEDGAPSVVGAWISPDALSADFDELWVFEDDAKTFHLYQVVKSNYKVQNTIDGTYELKEGGEIVVSMMGYPLTYTYEFDDTDTLVLSDHGTSAVYTRYTGEIKK